MITKLHYKTSFIAISLIPLALFLTACGDTTDSNATTESSDQKTKVTHSNTVNSTKNIPRKLDTSTINLADIFDTSPAKYAPMSECPFLSDKTAINTTDSIHRVKTGEESNERKRVSNTRCMWLTGTVIDISTDGAKTHKKMVEKDPDHYFLKKQKSPGSDASILYYQTKRNKPVPIGFGFFQNEKYINIETMFSVTSVERLQKTANEIATRLPNAPTIKSQEQKRIRKVNVCDDIWQKEALKTLFNVDRVVGQSRGAEGCNFLFSFKTEQNYKLKLILDFKKIKNQNICKNLKKKGKFKAESTVKNYEVVSNRTTSRSRVRHSLYACTDKSSLLLSTETFLVYPDATDKTGFLENHSEKLQQLLNNLVKRVQSTGS